MTDQCTAWVRRVGLVHAFGTMLWFIPRRVLLGRTAAQAWLSEQTGIEVPR